jgi:Tol biopolymer transport system component
LATLALAWLWVHEHLSAVEPQVIRFFVLPPDKSAFANPIAGTTTSTSAGAISPDGQNLAFTARDSSGKVLLWVRPLDSTAPRALPNTEGATLPFWSPNSRWIAFFAQGKLKKTDIDGGAPQVLCDAAVGEGGTWNRDGTIVFGPWLFSLGLSRVSSLGGEATLVTKGARQEYERFPSFLPDGHHFLYFAQGGNSGVYIGSLDSEESEHVLSADSAAIYAEGYLLFVRQGTLFAQQFDAVKLQLMGNPTRIAESVPFDFNAPAFSISANGILTYRTGTVGQNLQFAWFDRTGKLLGQVGPPGPYRDVNISPDGKRIAVHRHDGSGGDIWIFEPGGAITRLTFNPTQDNSGPIWSPDGSQIVFGSFRNAKWGLYLRSSSGAGPEELLLESDRPQVPMAWSPDGKSIVFWTLDPKTTWDLWLFSVLDRKASPLLNSPFHESHAQISPDGRWLTYHADPSGQYEIYVKPFPTGDGAWQVSSNGGAAPRWRADGREIFYKSAPNNGKIMGVPVMAAGNTFEHGVPQELFDSGWFSLPHTTNYHTYAVSADGQRFLVARPVSNPTDDKTSPPITVVLNWTVMLQQHPH